MIPTGWADKEVRLEAEFCVGDTVSAKQQNCRWRDGPILVCIEDKVADVLRFIAAAIGSGDDFGEDALFCAELFQSVGPGHKGRVVNRDDEILASFFPILDSFVETLVIMRLGQNVAVDDQIAEDAIPSGIEVSYITKLAVAVFKADFDVHVIDDFQGLPDRVVVEGRDVEHHHIQASDLGGLSDGHIFGWEVGILAEDAHVLAQLGLFRSIVQNDFCSRQ